MIGAWEEYANDSFDHALKHIEYDLLGLTWKSGRKMPVIISHIYMCIETFEHDHYGQDVNNGKYKFIQNDLYLFNSGPEDYTQFLTDRSKFYYIGTLEEGGGDCGKHD